MARLDWDNLRIFLAILEAGSISGAAKALNMSQPTVGRHLNALEEAAGATLFARSTRALKLTDTGQAILDNVRRMGSEVQTIERLIEGQVTTLSGTVKISVVEGLGTHWLPAEIAELHKKYPEISIDIQIENRFADLKLREADIAIRLARPVQGDLIAKKLTRYGFGFYAHKNYLARHGTPTRPSDLADHQMVGFIDQAVLTGLPRNEAWENALSAKRVLRSNSPSAQIAATCAGLGIGFHSHRWASSFPDLVRVLPDVNIGDLEVWLVAHEDLRHSARIRAVFDFLSDCITAQKGLFEEGKS